MENTKRSKLFSIMPFSRVKKDVADLMLIDAKSRIDDAIDELEAIIAGS
jgi:hypothetical protein